MATTYTPCDTWRLLGGKGIHTPAVVVVSAAGLQRKQPNQPPTPTVCWAAQCNTQLKQITCGTQVLLVLVEQRECRMPGHHQADKERKQCHPVRRTATTGCQALRAPAFSTRFKGETRGECVLQVCVDTDGTQFSRGMYGLRQQCVVVFLYLAGCLYTGTQDTIQHH